MRGVLAPDVVLKFLSCKWKCTCKALDSAYLANELKCTNACYLKDCSNMRQVDDQQNENDVSDEDYLDEYTYY